MNRIPSMCFASVSIDAVRDVLDELPSALLLAGVTVHVAYAGAGKGMRPLFCCPACERRVLLLYLPLFEGMPACRYCQGVAYPGQSLSRTMLGPIVQEVRRTGA